LNVTDDSEPSVWFSLEGLTENTSPSQCVSVYGVSRSSRRRRLLERNRHLRGAIVGWFAQTEQFRSSKTRRRERRQARDRACRFKGGRQTEAALVLLYDHFPSHDTQGALAVRHLQGEVGIPPRADRFPES
jgi:hypothetical protein